MSVMDKENPRKSMMGQVGDIILARALAAT